MRISDWSSDVCSSDLLHLFGKHLMGTGTELGRVRGLGSARSGSHHWLHQRITAVGNLILVLWLIITLLRLPCLEYEQVTAWLAGPPVAVPRLLMLANVVIHFRLGRLVSIADKVHDKPLK